MDDKIRHFLDEHKLDINFFDDAIDIVYLDFEKKIEHCFEIDGLRIDRVNHLDFLDIYKNKLMDLFLDEHEKNEFNEFFNFNSLVNYFSSHKKYQTVIQNKNNFKEILIYPNIDTNLEGILIFINEVSYRYKNFISYTSYNKKIDNLTRLFGFTSKYKFVDILQFQIERNRVIKFSVNNRLVSKVVKEDVNEFIASWISKASPEEKYKIESKLSYAINDAGLGSLVNFSFSSSRNSLSEKWYDVDCYVDLENNKRVVNVFISDITKELTEKFKLIDDAERDELTDLFNRSKLEKMINTTYKTLDSCGVFFFDLNSLKKINDELGHEMGDEVLKLAASSIRSISNRKSKSYRYGGDEFLMVSENIEEEEMAKIYNMWKTRIKLISNDHHIDFSMACGYSWSSNPNISELIKIADANMYKNKGIMKSESH